MAAPTYQDPSAQESDPSYQPVVDLVGKACLDYAKAETMTDALDRANMQGGIIATAAVAIVAYNQTHTTHTGRVTRKDTPTMANVSIVDQWSLVSQLYAPTNDGQAPEDKYLACGPTCITMIERFLFGPGPQLVGPDTVKDRILGQGVTGYTFLYQLSDYLLAHGIPNHWWIGHGVGSAEDRRAYRDALALGHPNIALYFWDVGAQSGGHFCDVVADDDAGTSARANPWTATFETYDAAWWSQAYQGCGLIVDIDPATFRAQQGLAQPPVAPSSPPITPTPTHAVPPKQGGALPVAKPVQFRMLFDGALHSQPDDHSPITTHVKKGDILTAVTGASAPWCSVRTAHGVWGWNRASSYTIVK